MGVGLKIDNEIFSYIARKGMKGSSNGKITCISSFRFAWKLELNHEIGTNS